MMAKSKSKENKGLIFAIVSISIVAIVAITALVIVLINNNSNKDQNSSTSSNNTNITDNAVRNSQINTQRHLDASLLVTIMNQYMANNNGRLPSINGDAEVKTLGSYFDDLKDVNGQPYKVQFVATADVSKIRGGIDYLNVFYYSDCDSDGNLIPSSSKRSFVVLYTNAEDTGYYCAGGSN